MGRVIDTADFATRHPGAYLAEVQECDVRHSRGGEEYYNLKFGDAHTYEILCYDVVMLEGRGAGIGLKKLLALGAARQIEGTTQYELDEPEQMVGRWVILHLVTEERNGYTNLVTDFAHPEHKFGYEQVTEANAEPFAAKQPVDEPDDGDDIPF